MRVCAKGSKLELLVSKGKTVAFQKALLFALILITQTANTQTKYAGDAHLCILRRANFVIGVVVSPPMLCYGTHEPRATDCEYTFSKPTWKEVGP